MPAPSSLFPTPKPPHPELALINDYEFQCSKCREKFSYDYVRSNELISCPKCFPRNKGNKE